MALFRKRATVYAVGSALLEIARNEVTDQIDKEALDQLEPEDANEAEQLLFELLMHILVQGARFERPMHTSMLT